MEVADEFQCGEVQGSALWEHEVQIILPWMLEDWHQVDNLESLGAWRGTRRHEDSIRPIS